MWGWGSSDWSSECSHSQPCIAESFLIIIIIIIKDYPDVVLFLVFVCSVETLGILIYFRIFWKHLMSNIGNDEWFTHIVLQAQTETVHIASPLFLILSLTAVSMKTEHSTDSVWSVLYVHSSILVTVSGHCMQWKVSNRKFLTYNTNFICCKNLTIFEQQVWNLLSIKKVIKNRVYIWEQYTQRLLNKSYCTYI